MKTYLMKIAALGTLAILLTGPVGASEWNHTEESQGRDGTLWANIPGVPNENDAQMPLLFAACAVGSHQSPIAINLTKKTIAVNSMIPERSDNNPQAEPERHADSLEVRYAPSISSAEKSGISTDDGNAYVFRNTGHAVQVSFSKGYPGRLLIGKDVYPLVQFHFHTPSEHRLIKGQDSVGQEYGGELHFVHQREDGRLAVLGVFLDASKHYAENPILKKIIENTPRKHDAYNEKTGAGLPLDPLKLIPVDNEHVFTYAGSLTTPPCSEGVSWYVMSEPLKVDSDQLGQLHGILSVNNNRIVQNTNSRTVEIHKDLQLDQDGDSRVGR